MNLATFLPEVGVGEIPEQVNTEHWNKYFQNLRNRVAESWEAAKRGYLTLKKVREDLGLPFVVGGGESAGEGGGALTTGQEQLFLDMQAVSMRLIELADDAINNRRTVGWFEPEKDLGIEMRPEDTTRVISIGGRAALVDAATGNPVPGSGTIGLHPVVWVGFGVATVAAIAATYLMATDNNETARVLAENKTLQTIANAERQAVEKGATPEEASKIGKTILKGAAELKEAEAKATKAKSEAGLPAALKTAGWLGVAAAGIYLAAKVVPEVIK